ncbi:hypothetical protein K7432_010628 [Basidiobolus ranarum]|uniref:Uncharacterized protein n=1 Tax=Basidiobolus ranarum TaxID=34480 RepID=A0ABR2VV60_9FUNG
MIEIFSRPFSSPVVIGAALLFLVCFLCAVRDYSPDWRLEKEKKANLNSKSNAELTNPTKNRFLLIPFVPLAFVYLSLRLIWGLFKIAVFCSVDGILWTFAKIPSLLYRSLNYVTNLPEVIRRIAPEYWELYILAPCTFVLDYGLKIFFKYLIPLSNKIVQLSIVSSHTILEAFHRSCSYLWGLSQSLAVALRNSFLGPFLHSCKTIVHDIFSWVISRGSFLGKLAIQCLHILALDLFEDCKDLCNFVQKISLMVSAAMKPVANFAVRNIRGLLKGIYSSYWHLLRKLNPAWEQFVQCYLLRIGSYIRESYHSFLAALRNYSILASWGLCKITYRSLVAIISWTWNVGLPRSRTIVANSLILFCESTFSFLCQAYYGSKYLYNHVLKKAYHALVEVHRRAVIASLRFYRIVRNTFWNSLKYIQVLNTRMWIPIRNVMTQAWQYAVLVSYSLCQKASVAVQFMASYTTRCGAILSSNFQSVIALLQPLVHILGETIKQIGPLSVIVLENTRKIMLLSQKMAQNYLERMWPVVLQYSVEVSNITSQGFSELGRLVKEGYDGIQPVILTWKENLTVAADEIIQYLGRSMIDWMKSVKAKRE